MSLFFSCPLKAQPFNPLLASMLQDTFSTYTSAFSSIKGMSASVYIPGQGMWQSTSGISFTGQAITQDMKFGIASNTKLFTATAMLILQENGILSLNDSLNKWLPGLNSYINPNITIRQLLNHTSGIPEVIFYSPWLDTIIANPGRVFTPNEVVSWVNTSLFQAGSHWSYSNTNYVIAGMIIKNATGFNLSKIIRDSILTPLNLDSTFFDLEEPVTGTLAHRWWNGNISTNPLSDYHLVSRVALNSVAASAGAIFSTSSEMSQWYHALFSGQLLNAASMAELTNFVSTGISNQQYGLGLFRETTQGFTYWGHGGDTWGYKSKMILDSCSGTIVCGLSNSYPNSMTSIPFLLYRVIKNHVPACANVINGNANVCKGQSVYYNVASIPNATSYQWTLPDGATGTSTTNGITVHFGALSVSGNITVKGINAYGSGSVSSKFITVNSLPVISTTSTATTICTGNSVSITASGASAYTWMPGSLSGNAINVSPIGSTTYTVTGTGLSGCTKTSTRTIIVAPCSTTLNLKLYIEGYYLGNGVMNNTLQNQGVYNASSTITDTVMIELRNVNAPYNVVSSGKSILYTNGTVQTYFPIVGNYYLVVKHRNVIQTWSANPITVSSMTNYDFTTAANKAYGSNQSEVESGVWALHSGDMNEDENIDLLDANMLETDINNFAFGYFVSDINGDGNVDLLDSPVVEENINLFVFSNHP